MSAISLDRSDRLLEGNETSFPAGTCSPQDVSIRLFLPPVSATPLVDFFRKIVQRVRTRVVDGRLPEVLACFVV